MHVVIRYFRTLQIVITFAVPPLHQSTRCITSWMFIAQLPCSPELKFHRVCLQPAVAVCHCVRPETTAKP